MITKLSINEFLSQSAGYPLIDVRSPVEYEHAHIPGALSLPLFSNEERSQIGTLYKHEGREKAMELGLEFYGKNMLHIISDLKSFSQQKQIYVHCWRGGMRSGVVAWMLDLFGYKVFVLQNGYKNFRTSVLESFRQQKNMVILGGKTGSAKTAVLKEMKLKGEQVVDLEALAHHKGSAFGGIKETNPPSQEQFENDLFIQFRNLNTEKEIWLEDESQRIGSVNLPKELWAQMRNSRVIYLDIPFSTRLNYLVNTYGCFSIDDLTRATVRIQKRLGGLETKNVIASLQEGNIHQAFAALLKYYDKFYDHATEQRDCLTITKVHSEKIDPQENGRLILNSKRN